MNKIIQELKQIGFFIILIVCIILLSQARCRAQSSFPDSLKGIKLDIQYSKKYQLYVVSPFGNKEDCAKYEYKLSTMFYRPMKDIWENEQWWISKQCNEMGCYYTFKKL